MANKAVTAPIIGVRTREQLEQSLEAVEVSLDETVMNKLDEIFLGPRGTCTGSLQLVTAQKDLIDPSFLQSHELKKSLSGMEA